MRQEFMYPSRGAGTIHAVRWLPDGELRGVVQLVHGIAEHVGRYEEFARFLNAAGYLVVAEDHMGHGQSRGGVRGYFHGGWYAAAEDTYRLLTDTKQAYPRLPYILFGHSMGSFMVRTILIDHPDSGIDGAVICGTCWMPRPVLKAGLGICRAVCRRVGEENPSHRLQKLVFGGYNSRVDHPRTSHDWLSRDKERVDAYIADPMCGFVPSAGLLRDMLTGLDYIGQGKNLAGMRKDLPVFFIAGADDPVGSYGSGVETVRERFCKAGMTHTGLRLYPLCRHELLNEINRREIYKDVLTWIESSAK